MAEKLEVTYQDVTLEHNGSSVIDPLCIVDMGLKTGDTLVIKVRIINISSFTKNAYMDTIHDYYMITNYIKFAYICCL